MMSGNRLWILVGSVLIVAILAIGYFLAIVPKMAEADQTVAQQQQALATQNAAAADLAKLKGQYSSLDQLTAKLQTLQLAIAGTPDGSSFSDELATFESQSGARITDILFSEGQAATTALVPLPATSATPDPNSTPAPAATTAPPAAPASGAASPGGVYAVRVALKLNGTPSQIIAFSKLAQQGQRYFLDTDLTFTTASADSGAAAGGGNTGSSGSSDSASAGSSTSTGTLGGYIYVIEPLPGLPTPTATAVAPVPTDTATSTPNPTDTPTP